MKEKVEVLVRKELSPTPSSSEVIAQAMTLLYNMAGTTTMPAVLPVPTVPTSQYPGVQYAIVVSSRLDDISLSSIFLRPVKGEVMTGEEHDLFWRFTKIKPPIFYGYE